LNLMYPFGYYFVNGMADFKAPEHLVLEGIILLIMATMVLGQYLRNRRMNTFPFGFTKLDTFFYPIVISALIISLFFVLDQSQRELTDFPKSVFLLIQSPIDYKIIAIIVLHAFGIAIISFLWIVSRRNTQIQDLKKIPL
jgi:divalent metal cation (Fe/Co/Zn/Cd) transporter